MVLLAASCAAGSLSLLAAEVEALRKADRANSSNLDSPFIQYWFDRTEVAQAPSSESPAAFCL